MAVSHLPSVSIAGRAVGHGEPTYVIAEIGLNHNGSLELAKKLIDAAHLAGCDAVKFQKRTPELCVPKEQQSVPRETPWGTMTYLEYRHRVELSLDEYAEIDAYCSERGIHWFTSCWDEKSVDLIEALNPPAYKIASASLTDTPLLDRLRATGKPLILSTGMSTHDEVRAAIAHLGTDQLLVAHCTSTYPCPAEELNLRVIQSLRDELQVPVGYSGHEVGLQTTAAAVTLGACFVERHITLDRAMWGSDQAASVEPWGFMRLVRDIRTIEAALGDGVKRLYDSELPARQKLRRRGATTP
ncbi:MAG: N-acetylneuraminate synthase family protein [Acidobacteriota bacterium]